MSIFSDLFSIHGKLHMFSILITVCILTIFELIFFYVVIIPQVNDLLDEKYNLLETQVLELAEEKKVEFLNTIDIINLEVFKYIPNDNINNINNNIDTIDTSIQNIFKLLVDREQILIEQNNTNTLITSITIVLFLLCFLIFTGISIKNNLKEGQSHQVVHSILMGCTIVAILIGFQILFYNFSNNYIYTTNNGLLKLIIENINVD